MRLIDADALKGKESYIMMTTLDTCFGSAKIFLTETIDNAPTVNLPRWILVTERLPDFNTNVLVSYNNGTVSLAQFKEAFGTGYWFDYDNMCGSRKVIAWAPLPAPYVEPTDEPSASELRGEEYWADLGDEE